MRQALSPCKLPRVGEKFQAGVPALLSLDVIRRRRDRGDDADAARAPAGYTEPYDTTESDSMRLNFPLLSCGMDGRLDDSSLLATAEASPATAEVCTYCEANFLSEMRTVSTLQNTPKREHAGERLHVM